MYLSALRLVVVGAQLGARIAGPGNTAKRVVGEALTEGRPQYPQAQCWLWGLGIQTVKIHRWSEATHQAVTIESTTALGTVIGAVVEAARKPQLVPRPKARMRSRGSI